MPIMRTPDTPDGGGDTNGFPTTRWSLVARAGQAGASGEGGDARPGAAADDRARREALGHVLTLYLPALRAHLLAKRVPPDRVDDLLQGFVAAKVIERNLLGAADRARGRFRAFLVTALNHFVANQLRHDRAGKRAPRDAKVLALDAEAGLDPADERATADAFDVAWAREALAEALRRVRDECLACGRADLWEVLEVRVLAPALDGAEPLAYAEMVRRFGYATPKQAANALVTAKRRLEQALRSVVAEYASDEQDLEHELAALAAALAAAPHTGSGGDDDRHGAALRAVARAEGSNHHRPADRPDSCAADGRHGGRGG